MNMQIGTSKDSENLREKLLVKLIKKLIFKVKCNVKKKGYK